MHRLTKLLIFLAGTICLAPLAWAQSGGKTGDLERAIREYLLNHPEVIIEALEKYEERQKEAQQHAARMALKMNRDVLFEHPMTPVAGAKGADVTIVEFFDYQCGYCKQVLKTVLSILEEDRKVRIVWKDMPILGPTSEFAARAAVAAARQGKYFEFHTQVMGARGQLTPQKVLNIAGRIGLDTERLKRDMGDPKIATYLADTTQLAQTLGITGTPGFVIGDKVVAGAIGKDQFRQLIEAARKKS